MINKLKYILSIIALFVSANVLGQNTTNSPYSQFGLGDIKTIAIPQTLGMGGITMGIRKPGGYSNINVANPASYSAINLSTFDIGAGMDFRKLSKATVSEKTTNGTLSHLLFGIPVSTKSAISFGLMPFSDLGYQYRTQITINSTKIDHLYSGDGGLAKAHLGYGYKLSDRLSLGLNLSYIFGNLKINQSTEFPEDPTALSSRTQNEKNIGGLNYQYGVQYIVNPSAKRKLIIGYSGSFASNIKTSGSVTTYHYTVNTLTEYESAPLDTTYYNANAQSKIKLPQTHTIGFAFENTNKWVLGADFTYTQWSKFAESGSNAGLKNSYGLALGGQFTPDATAVSNYLKLIDYSLGLRYNKTYININDHNINQYALCFGLGLPLPGNRTAFYKINFSAEVGKRGTLSDNLVRENYLNLHLGFTLNDRWFIKPKYD
ncbi:MAG: outer membrane protein transport protein [Sphingobacteriaceae bacterium]